MVIVCLISATQYWAGWKLQGTEIVDSEKRARALFSHPLSLAYILLLYVPLVTALAIRSGRSRPAWAMVLALIFLIFVSSSRTVQAVVACMGAVFVVFGLKGRRRVVGILVGLGLTGLISFTDNPVRQRIISTIEQKEDRQQNKYADDRIAFWVVHMDMFKQKPSLGHGLSYRQEYLDRFYEEHGLLEFKKKYPAHNMFLQVLVNSGVVGFLIWFWRIVIDVWACLLMIRGIRPVRDRWQSAGSRAWIGWAGLATIVGVMLAGLTQNAFQDSAVRFHWTILEGLLLWLTSRQEVSDARGQEAIPA
jgi:O-antigen ligase